MIDRFAQMPRALRERVRTERLGPTEVPALLAHPDWSSPAPVVLWMHGRTVNKELDAGRYHRWVRAGIAACSIDLPGHGERFDERYHDPARTPDLLSEVLGEIDAVLAALTDARFEGVFDPERVAIGGMSAGGMAALRRLCDPHGFVCAAVEGTTGFLSELYHPSDAQSPGRPWPVDHAPEDIRPLDPIEHLEGWAPLPLLALHAEGDEVVPFRTQALFLEQLRDRYAAAGADTAQIELMTWRDTGAPREHAGFGRYGNDAKNAQVDFLRRHLLGEIEAR